MSNFEDLLGKTLVGVSVNDTDDQILFRTSDGAVYQQHHEQDCCESVYVESVVGDLSDLIGNPILLAEEVCNRDANPTDPAPAADLIEYQESFTWAFYKLSTIKGSITIRWYGSSNGYYSERVDFVEIVPPMEPTQ